MSSGVPDEPLIWTTKGNLPRRLLAQQVSWQDTPQYVKCRIQYFLGGELVREDCHAMSRAGQSAAAAQAKMGG